MVATVQSTRYGSRGSVLSDLIFTAAGLNSLSSGSGSSCDSVSPSAAAPALAAFAVGALGVRTMRRRWLVSVTGGAAARSRSTFSSSPRRLRILPCARFSEIAWALVVLVVVTPGQEPFT